MVDVYNYITRVVNILIFIYSDLQSTVELMSKEVLGILAEDFSAHSLRPGCAMAFHLADITECVIKLIGCRKMIIS